MKLSVENIGKFKKASIEINGITVIAGENNTGKSTLGKVLYCIFTPMYDIENKCKQEKLKFIKSEIVAFLNNVEKKNEDQLLSNILNRKRLDDVVNIENPDSVEECESVLNKMKLEYDFIDSNEFVKFSDNLRRVFGFPLNLFAAYIFGRFVKEEFNGQITNVKHDGALIEFEIAGKKHQIIFTNSIPLTYDMFDSYIQAIYLDNPFVIDNKKRQNRTSFNNRVVQEDHQKDLCDKFYGMPIREESTFDEIFYNERIRNVLEKIFEAAEGKFVVENGELMFLERGFDKPFYLKNLSTGLKTFVIFKRLIENKAIVDKGVLILDEPEIHLHPEWQLLLAEVIVALQKEFDLHVLITTHSPYFLNAIEVFTAKHKIADKSKYYLTKVDDEGYASIEDVTANTDKIYSLLAHPMKRLYDMEFASDGGKC